MSYDDKRFDFEVPTPAGLVRVDCPINLQPMDGIRVANRIYQILLAMFTPIDIRDEAGTVLPQPASESAAEPEPTEAAA